MALLTEAIAGALLLQVPPVVASVSVVVKPAHTVKVPAMATGGALTVTVAVDTPGQPVLPLEPVIYSAVVDVMPVGL